MKIIILFLLYLIPEIICLFEEEIIMEKPSEGYPGIFFRRLDENNFYISNSVKDYIFNIRVGTKEYFGGIIPESSTIYEPFLLFENNKPSYIIDAYSKNNYIKIYDIENNKYREYTGLKINEGQKRKFAKYEVVNDNKFIIGIQDENDNFHIRMINANGTEIFRSQEVDVKNSDDFCFYAYKSGDNKAIFVIIFYEDKFVMHQWYRNGNNNVNYYTEQILSNQFIKHTNIQLEYAHRIFCSQDLGDVNCHKISFNWNGGFTTKKFNIQMLQECKSIFKLNYFNKERFIVSCLNTNNEYIIQIFNENLVRDYDMNGITIFKNDEINNNFEYDALQGKDNELVVLKVDVSKNKYYLETFNFIKNSSNLYELCPDGCQDCYYLKNLGIKFRNNTLIQKTTLNCSLCKFNRYFADNYADICFLKKERPNGYEFMEQYKKFVSCEYCCKTGENSDICTNCINKDNYGFYVDEPNNGRCSQNCSGEYRFIDYNKRNCISSCNGNENCCSYSNYLLNNNLNNTSNN